MADVKRVRKLTPRAEEALLAKEKTTPIAKKGNARVRIAKKGNTQLVWPGGSKWQPTTHNWGTRNPEFYGCGKCRFRPSGCRGCIAAAASFDYSQAHWPNMPAGRVLLPDAGVDEDCDKGGDVATRRLKLERELLQAVELTSVGVVDQNGSGVVARRALRAGETLEDPSVVFVPRPSDYARAHLPQYNALEFGSMGFFRLREAAFGHCSLTYYVNEAHHHGGAGPDANVRYKVVRPRGGGAALALEVIAPLVPAGAELLAKYNQELGR